ncbi:MAG: S41 family peptidase [Fibromonadaceae bacterium]|jgi:carboxyl-terminal processing protease|nr:S41 family peptidase [Fibromonadaceae bacterium]
MKSVKLSLLSLFILFAIFTACGKPSAEAKASGDFYEELSRLNKVISEINLKYVEDVDPSELTEAAISGMRNVLDPNTAVLDPKASDNLKLATDGEFGGIGITIGIRDNQLTVISPMAGTPAYKLGIMAGDRITHIDGKPTKDLTQDESVDRLRGKVGTDVKVTISREGVAAPFDITITRAKIVLHAVPYAGMLDKDIGYIQLATFNVKTASELEEAINKLKKQGMKKLILDLRYNPGGLLNQAIEVSELFLKGGNRIVSTKGRVVNSENKATRNGIIGEDTQIAILVNQGTASAAEIVSGALQDWDRAIVVGKTTFGKGSVQTIFPLDYDGRALKLTTAFYYLPFGRCVNKPENGIKGHGLRSSASSEDSDDLISSPADTSQKDTAQEAQVYYTAGGRKMYGGGGITPDVDIEQKPIPWIAQIQERMSLYFRFAVKYRSQIGEAAAKIDSGWKVPDTLFSAFRAFCAADTNFAKIKSNAQTIAEAMEEALLKEQNIIHGDSSKVLKDTAIAAKIADLRAALAKQNEAQALETKSYSLSAIKRELISAAQGEEARIAWMLRDDTQLAEALKYLRNDQLYKNKMKAPPKTQQKNDKKAKPKK